MDYKMLFEIFQSAINAANPSERVAEYSDYLRSIYNGGKFSNIYLIGFGKAVCKMAEGIWKDFGDLVEEGVLVTKYGHSNDFGIADRIRVFEAGHPVPDEHGMQAAGQIIKLVKKADEKTLIICLISGGGSSLLVMPASGVTLQEKKLVTDMLLRTGATIEEFNSVRKHISMVKGGHLAAMAYPATTISLILSDVIDDPLDVIASGPTVADPSTFGDALSILQKYHLNGKVPKSVLSLLKEGLAGNRPETPKRESSVLERVKNFIIGNNRHSLDSAALMAKKNGFDVVILSYSLSGEARDVAKIFAEKALSVQRDLNSKSDNRRICLLAGGETTVTVTGEGKGGRNTEMALAFAMAIEGKKNILFASAGTDGTDGPTDAAGAVVDGETISRGLTKGYEAKEYLYNNDSYTFFKNTDGLLITGPTGTNVMDIQIALISANTEIEGCEQQ